MNWFVNHYGDRNKLFRDCYLPTSGKKITVVLEGENINFANTNYYFAFRLEKGIVKRPLVSRNYITKRITIPAGSIQVKDSIKLNIDYDKIIGVAVVIANWNIGLSIRTPERYFIGGRHGLHSEFLTLDGNRGFGEKFYRLEIPAKGTYLDIEVELLTGALGINDYIDVLFELERPFKL
jgi:hypothetical protein